MKYRSLMAVTVLSAMLLSGCGKTDQTSQPDLSEPSVSAVGAVSTVEEPAASQPVEVVPPEPVVTVTVNKTAEELIALSEQGNWSHFEDAVFIGDSVTLKLKNFVTKQRQSVPEYFGTGQFLTSGSLGSGNALWEVSGKSVHPAYQGEKMLLEESIPLTGAKKIYMMLGINDIAVYGLEGAVENYKLLMDRILETVPDAQFYIQSATPIVEGAETGGLTNENLERYNLLLKEMCEERKLRFVDVASVMKDENGYLIRDYCSDPDGMGIHLMDDACKLWLGYLLEDAGLMQGSYN